MLIKFPMCCLGDVPNSNISPLCTRHNKQGVCHIVALPFTLKNILKKAKEEWWKFSFTNSMMFF
jgi:hypothetical protein